MKVTHYGHACFSVKAGGKHLLFDPYIKENPAAPDMDLNTLKPDVILVSHGHFDHILDAVEIAKNSKAQVIANFEICQWFHQQGYQNCQPLNVGGTYKADWGTVRGFQAVHGSSFPDGSYAGIAQGFIVETDEGTFYYSGDTAATYDLKMIGERYKLDFAILPIGDIFTMGIDDAIMVSGFIQCDRILGVHYDTWAPITIDKEQAKKKFAKAGKELILLEPGVEKDI